MRNLSGGSIGSTSSGSSSGSCSNLIDNQYSSNNFSHFNFDVATFANNPRTPAPVNNNNSTIASSRVFSSPHSSSCGTSHRNSRQERSSSFFSDNNNGSNNSNTSDRQGSSSSSSPSSQQQQSQRSVNSSRYKTELCRPFEESGSCKYGDKCQFAHGMHELRNLSRHPKYKTELCRTFHTIGYCPYGPRCHFIHEEEPGSGKSLPLEAVPPSKLGRCGSVQSSSGSSSPSLSPSGCSDVNSYNNVFCYQSEQRQGQDNRQLNALTVNVNYNSGSSSSSSSSDPLDKQFGMMNLNGNDNGTQDIFSHITTFSEEELLDNASIPPAFSTVHPSSFQTGRQQLDNFPSFSESSYWHPALNGKSSEDFLSCILGSLSGQESKHNLMGSSTEGSISSGSDSGSSGGSDCGGSTENLNSSVFSEWRNSVAIGQY